MADLLNPKEIDITLRDGSTKRYVLSTFPAVQGREIMAVYASSNLPKIGNYSVSEEIMLKLMCYVAAISNDKQVPLVTMVLVNNHVPDHETLAKIEMAMMEYNNSFFQNGTLLNFLADTIQRSLASITGILTHLSAQSSAAGRPPSTSSGPSIQ
jgi:hypothetical protein